ncbi:MAG: type II toxin-antitoxin system prevent-host-death family antitoxin [Vicinamibacterales bacterium]
MKSVGVRELKNRLSQYLREVRSGATVQVTDRGVVVAELSPPGRALSDPSTPPGVLLLARRGLATVGSTGQIPPLYPALRRRRRRRRTAAQLLDDERGSR